MKEEKPIIEEFIIFCIGKMFELINGNNKEDPSIKTVKAIMGEYGFDKDKAWSAFKPVFWYLCPKKKIIKVEHGCWHLHRRYRRMTSEAKDKLVGNVIKAYGQTLIARLNNQSATSTGENHE